MAVADVLQHASYQGGAGPGIYDVHSPWIPEVAAPEGLLRRALRVIGPDRLWVNPDCGLKTRRYDQVIPVLDHMVVASRSLREEVASGETSRDADVDAARTNAPPGP
jgi:5-methyltetrahydropteroyltriglutamate--homocysteine methyltransferase